MIHIRLSGCSLVDFIQYSALFSEVTEIRSCKHFSKIIRAYSTRERLCSYIGAQLSAARRLYFIRSGGLSVDCANSVYQYERKFMRA